MSEEVKIEVKEKFNFKKWLKGNSKSEFIENSSYLIIILSAVLIFFGLLLGSFIKYTVMLAAFGSFILLIGIVFYIVSQLIEKPKEEKVE